ncbi:MAG: aspartate/glutamate racemase family protein [Candidatus Marinimicrobia bacterium]|nr:aspartate/glutamate racemase family protein [Candidatus Neomarinimicrobiota bacterium]
MTAPLKTVGLLGGMSAEATKEYYRLINDGVQRELGGHNSAELLISSVNFQLIEQFIKGGQWEAAGVYLAEKARGLEAGGAECLLLCTNTMHKVSAAVEAAITIPFIDIFEVTAHAVNQAGLRRIGLLGTYPVMSDPFFAGLYAGHGLEIMVPDEADRREIDRIIFDELCLERFTTEAKSHFLKVMDDLSSRGAEGIILGCTEINLIVSQSDAPATPLFDTTALHCAAAVALTLGREWDN